MTNNDQIPQQWPPADWNDDRLSPQTRRQILAGLEKELLAMPERDWIHTRADQPQEQPPKIESRYKMSPPGERLEGLEGRAKNLIRNIWQGNYTLAQHYWLCLGVPSFVLNLVFMGLEYNSLAFGDYIELLYGSIFVGSVAVVVIGGVGLWRCISKRVAARGWDWKCVLAAIALILGLIRFTESMASLVTGTPDVDANRNLAEEVRATNAQLPHKEDDTTTWTAIRYDWNQHILTFVYQIDDSGYTDNPQDRGGRIRQKLLSDPGCADYFSGHYAGVRKARFIYYYTTKGHAADAIEISKSDCSS